MRNLVKPYLEIIQRDNKGMTVLQSRVNEAGCLFLTLHTMRMVHFQTFWTLHE